MLNWEEGEGHYHFMLCFAILLHSQSCTSREGSFLAHIITYLQNKKVIKQKVPDFFRRIKYLIIPPH